MVPWLPIVYIIGLPLDFFIQSFTERDYRRKVLKGFLYNITRVRYPVKCKKTTIHCRQLTLECSTRR